MLVGNGTVNVGAISRTLDFSLYEGEFSSADILQPIYNNPE